MDLSKIKKITNEMLGKFENKIDSLSKSIDAGIDSQINEERLESINLLFEAGQLIKELNRSIPNGERN